ncbi:hypothetical protein Hanom_Chr07g00595451 [Helianthus anomalus]
MFSLHPFARVIEDGLGNRSTTLLLFSNLQNISNNNCDSHNTDSKSMVNKSQEIACTKNKSWASSTIANSFEIRNKPIQK